MLKIRLLYKFCVGCQYILSICYLFANFDCMNWGTVWGFSKSQMLFCLVIWENGDEANTS